jgi:hypothetical protein
MHENLLTQIYERSEELNLSVMGPLLDQLADAATEVVVSGPIKQEEVTSSSEMQKEGTSSSITLTPSNLSVNFDADNSMVSNNRLQRTVAQSGPSQHRVHFGTVVSVLRKITETLGTRRIWVLLDEWSVVPIELQPNLADFLRRALLPVAGITVKIAAIEQRANFRIPGTKGDYIGIELGADVSADVNLDDFMVFENDAQRATRFFKELLYKHCAAVFVAEKINGAPRDASALIQHAFTQQNVFEEFVRAAEGVPRDAINIASLAAQKAIEDPISIGHVRTAAKAWYQRDKEAAIMANPNAHHLLLWIIAKVIAHRRARAFLLRSNTRHPLIDDLFDSRVLHLLKRNIAAHDQPGVRYDVYKIDFGCYVDLLVTAKAPVGLLPTVNEQGQDAGFVDVPPDDYRAIRRAILNLSEFDATPKS